MPEVRIDELYVSSIQPVPAEIKIDELNVTALTTSDPVMDFDRLYARGVAILPASVVVENIHMGGIRRKTPSWRFKQGYKEEVLTTLGNGLAVTLSPNDYDIELRGLVSGDPKKVNLRLTAKKVSGYRRFSDVTYKRLEADVLRPLIDFNQLLPTEVNPLDTTSQIVARINTLFGTKFTELDFVEEATPIGSDRLLTARAESFYFQPGSQINLGRMDQNERSTEIVGLAWSEFDSWSLKIAATDFTANASLLSVNVGTILNSTHTTNVLAALTAMVPGHGFNGNTYTHATVAKGLLSAPFQQLTLPAVTDLPVDNSGFYNRALVIDLGLSPTSTFRYLICHYNV